MTIATLATIPVNTIRLDIYVICAGRTIGATGPIRTDDTGIADYGTIAETRSGKEYGTRLLQHLPCSKVKGLIIPISICTILACETRKERDTIRTLPVIRQQNQTVNILCARIVQ